MRAHPFMPIRAAGRMTTNYIRCEQMAGWTKPRTQAVRPWYTSVTWHEAQAWTAAATRHMPAAREKPRMHLAATQDQPKQQERKEGEQATRRARVGGKG